MLFILWGEFSLYFVQRLTIWNSISYKGQCSGHIDNMVGLRDATKSDQKLIGISADGIASQCDLHIIFPSRDYLHLSRKLN